MRKEVCEDEGEIERVGGNVVDGRNDDNGKGEREAAWERWGMRMVVNSRNGAE